MLALFMLPMLVWTVFLLVFIVPLCLLFLVFWIWMLVDVIQNKGLGEGEKIGWVLAIVFLHFVGAALYFFIGHPKRKLVTSS
jgi:hypothetical protein